MKNPVRATEVISFLKDKKMKLFYPMPSKEHKGHYSTFVDMCNKKSNELPKVDTHLPSYDEDLGCCTYCPKFVFLSKTEKKGIFKCTIPKEELPFKGKPLL